LFAIQQAHGQEFASEFATRTTTKFQKMEVFILAGQSNMAGRGAITAQLIGDAYLNGLKVMRFSAANEWEIGVEPMHKDVDLRKVRAIDFDLVWEDRVVC
jgi:hypothetical protein